MISCVLIIEVGLFSKSFSCFFSIKHSAAEVDILGEEFIEIGSE
jgi:hypothetical protein